MIDVSDRTLAELLADRLRAAGLFQFFARRLGPHAGVHVSAIGWDASGVYFVVKLEAASLGEALVQMLVACDQAKAAGPPTVLRTSSLPAPYFASSVGNAHRVAARARDVERRPQAMRVALERATRLGSITPLSLAAACGCDLGPAMSKRHRELLASYRDALERLVDAGELVKPDGSTDTYVPAPKTAEAE